MLRRRDGERVGDGIIGWLTSARLRYWRSFVCVWVISDQVRDSVCELSVVSPRDEVGQLCQIAVELVEIAFGGVGISAFEAFHLVDG